MKKKTLVFGGYLMHFPQPMKLKRQFYSSPGLKCVDSYLRIEGTL